jgi:hypothetical protein
MDGALSQRRAPQGEGPDEGPLRYVETRPATALRRMIACYWQIRGLATTLPTHTHHILSDACTDLILDAGMWRRTGRAGAMSFVGTMTHAVRIELRSGLDLLGVRFRPGGAAALFRCEVHELTDRDIPLRDLWSPFGSEVTDRLAASATLAQRKESLDSEFLKRLPRQGPPERKIERAVLFLDDADASILEAGRVIGWSTRQLERRFSGAVGLTPVQFRRVRRLRRLLTLHALASSQSLAALAVESVTSTRRISPVNFTLLSEFRRRAGWRRKRMSHSYKTGGSQLSSLDANARRGAYSR